MSPRTGSCLRCGMCCVEPWRFAYEAKMILPDVPDMESLHLPTDPKARERKEGEGACPRFAWDPETGLAVCTIQETKGEICQRFPIFLEDIVFEGCGFSFEAPA